MALFKKKKEKTVTPDKKVKTKSKEQIAEKKPESKKKIRIGFRKKNKEKTIKLDKSKEEKTEEPFEEDISEENETALDQKEEQKTPSKKKKPLIKKDFKGKPVFLEDTGEKLGIVYDAVVDKDNNIIGYKIKDDKSDAILSFTVDQFDYSKEGLIFVPSWYTNALKIIEKLEFKDKISPELTALLSEDVVSNEELYDIFVKYDDDMVHYIDDAKSLREMLNSRLKVLEKQRLAMKNDLMDLTERRLIKDIDRRQFSEDVMYHRRKVNILDLNIKKCKDLIKRLDNTSFGVLGKTNFTHVRKDSKVDRNLYEKVLREQKSPEIRDVPTLTNDIYKEKYLNLKAQYHRLEEDYQELKTAVDKLFSKEEL